MYERIGEDLLAESIYKQGIAITKRLNQRHAQGELQGAFEELTFWLDVYLVVFSNLYLSKCKT